MYNNIIENRKYTRFQFEYLIEHRLFSDKQWKQSYADNISLNGIRINSQFIYIKDDTLEIKLTNPNDISEKMILDGKVKWIIKEDLKEYYNIGIQYNNLKDEQNLFLQTLINKSLKNKLQKKQYPIKNTYKILFIDDNKSLTKLFKCLSYEYNFEAFVANNSEDGIRIALEKKPDVIITDIKMPDIDGFSCTSKIKTNKKIQHIPIIGCSITYPKSEKKFYLIGGNKFLNDKPTSIEKLNKIVEGIIPPFKTK